MGIKPYAVIGLTIFSAATALGQAADAVADKCKDFNPFFPKSEIITNNTPTIPNIEWDYSGIRSMAECCHQYEKLENKDTYNDRWQHQRKAIIESYLNKIMSNIDPDFRIKYDNCLSESNMLSLEGQVLTINASAILSNNTEEGLVQMIIEFPVDENNAPTQNTTPNVPSLYTRPDPVSDPNDWRQ